MHSARWDPAWSAAGRRVAVIGTGSSAIQLVPVIQPRARSLTLFQRTPAYVMPHNNRPGFVMRPQILRSAEGLWRRHLEAAVSDPRLREQLTPGYPSPRPTTGGCSARCPAPSGGRAAPAGISTPRAGT
jgi:hypothetical protein